MKLITYKYTTKWNMNFNKELNSKQTLVIVFASSNKTLIQKPLNDITSFFCDSTIIGSSTSGEIFQDELLDDSMSIAVIKFETTLIKSISLALNNIDDSYNAGIKISNDLQNEDLKAMFILSDGLNVNGSKLTSAISSTISSNVVVTGGLAGDGDKFEDTWVIVDGKVTNKYITAVGLYGNNINISHGSKGGWDSLGIQRLVTKSKDNILYELDYQPALEIYKKYLGKKADDLPASGLLFPLELKSSNNSMHSKVRTILAVNEKEQSITFAGDIPKNSYVTLMKANYDRLIDGATNAAKDVFLDNYNNEEILSIAISCVGRKLVLKQRTEEELEATLDILPKKTKQIGFYSYGEISPLSSGDCDLHNQTMTLTLIWENNA